MWALHCPWHRCAHNSRPEETQRHMFCFKGQLPREPRRCARMLGFERHGVPSNRWQSHVPCRSLIARWHWGCS